MSSINSAPASSKGHVSPRVIAARIFARWGSIKPDRRPQLNTLLQEELGRPSAALSTEDRALAGEIVTGSVRWLRLLTTVVDSRLKKPAKVPPIVKAVLVTACYQLMFLDRVPPFAIVNEAVKAAKKVGASWASGLVNALLRRLIREMEGGGKTHVVELATEGARGPADSVAIRLSYPTWMVRRWIDEYGIEQAEAICRAGNCPPPLNLRVNATKLTRLEALDLLEGSGIGAEESMLSPHGLIFPEFRGNPAAIPGLSEGLFYVQDQSAQLVTLLLQCQKGQRVLDMCAGLGGKTTHIAELTGDEAVVDAWDTSEKRLSQLKANAERLGLHSIRVLSETEFRAREGERTYDRILVDAPCSGLGVMGRHPDIKWNRQKDDIKRLSGLQTDLLEKAASMINPGGRLVYAVCTTEREETQEVVERFLASHGGWRHVPVESVSVPVPAKYVSDEGFLRIIPEENGPDGFFAAILLFEEKHI